MIQPICCMSFFVCVWVQGGGGVKVVYGHKTYSNIYICIFYKNLEGKKD